MRFLLLIISSCALSCNPPVEQKLSAPLYSFVVAGHIYGSASSNTPEIHPPFKKSFSQINNDSIIKMVFLTGDMVKTSDSLFFDSLDQQLTNLKKPIYKVAGNHDYSNPALYENTNGKSFYSFEYENDLFIVLNSQIDKGTITGKQLYFLLKTLQKSNSTQTIYVFFHELLWWNKNNLYKDIAINCNYCLDYDSINFWNKIEPLFNELKNPVFFFAGDLGGVVNSDSYFYHKYDNITFCATGMGKGKRDNYLIVSKEKTGEVSVDVQFISNEKKRIDIKEYNLPKNIFGVTLFSSLGI